MGQRKISGKRGSKMSDLAVQQNKNLASMAMDPDQWGRVTLSKNDIIIPRLQLVQAMSDNAIAKTAEAGEIRDSLNNSLLAKVGGKPLNVVPFHVYKKFNVMKIIETRGKEKREFHEVVPIIDNPLEKGYNDDLPWKDIIKINGVDTKIDRIRTYDIFFVIPELGRDVAYMMSFASTATKAAKNIMLQMALNQEDGMTPAAYSFNLSILQKSNDEGTWYVVDATLGKEAAEEDQAKAFKWYKRLSSGQAKVAEESPE